MGISRKEYAMAKTLIIAEAGVNHNGELEIAKELAREAKKCGADIVKFQTAKLSSLVSKTAKIKYWSGNEPERNAEEAVAQL